MTLYAIRVDGRHYYMTDDIAVCNNIVIANTSSIYANPPHPTHIEIYIDHNVVLPQGAIDILTDLGIWRFPTD